MVHPLFFLWLIQLILRVDFLKVEEAHEYLEVVVASFVHKSKGQNMVDWTLQILHHFKLNVVIRKVAPLVVVLVLDQTLSLPIFHWDHILKPFQNMHDGFFVDKVALKSKCENWKQFKLFEAFDDKEMKARLLNWNVGRVAHRVDVFFAEEENRFLLFERRVVLQ